MSNVDDVRELVEQRLQFVTEDYQDARNRHQSKMKCFHQGQIDAYQEVLEMLEENDEF